MEVLTNQDKSNILSNFLIVIKVIPILSHFI